MNLNLLIHIDNFRWENITTDRSRQLDSLAIGLETISDYGDICWHHPDSHNICYQSWGCLHDIIQCDDFNTIKDLFGWIKHNNYKILLDVVQKPSNSQTLTKPF